MCRFIVFLFQNGGFMSILSRSDFLANKTLPLKLIRRDPQEEYSLHSHEFSELVIVYRGSGEHLIYGERRHISAGDIFLIKGQTRHGYENLHDLALCNLLFDLHEAGSPLFALSRYPMLRRLFLLEPGRTSGCGFQLSPEQMPQIMELLDAIEEEQNSRREDYASAMSALFVLLIIRLSRLHSITDSASENVPIELYRLLNELSDRSSEHWTRTRMAKAAGMSISTLTRQFHRATGYPPNEYLLRLRLKKSVMLLLNPGLSISEIAARSGFADSNYFCRQFRKYYGESPLRYRKKNRDV